jgi:hypothetical protein
VCVWRVVCEGGVRVQGWQVRQDRARPAPQQGRQDQRGERRARRRRRAAHLVLLLDLLHLERVRTVQQHHLLLALAHLRRGRQRRQGPSAPPAASQHSCHPQGTSPHRQHSTLPPALSPPPQPTAHGAQPSQQHTTTTTTTTTTTNTTAAPHTCFSALLMVVSFSRPAICSSGISVASGPSGSWSMEPCASAALVRSALRMPESLEPNESTSPMAPASAPGLPSRSPPLRARRARRQRR